MIIENAKYTKDLGDEINSIKATIDSNVVLVPIDTANRHYVEILKQVADGDITIAEAD